MIQERSGLCGVAVWFCAVWGGKENDVSRRYDLSRRGGKLEGMERVDSCVGRQESMAKLVNKDGVLKGKRECGRRKKTREDDRTIREKRRKRDKIK